MGPDVRVSVGVGRVWRSKETINLLLQDTEKPGVPQWLHFLDLENMILNSFPHFLHESGSCGCDGAGPLRSGRPLGALPSAISIQWR
jgi:hypothetical protein